MTTVDDLPTMERYDLIFRGEIREGTELETVKKKLAALYGVDTGEIESLFSGPPVYIRRSMDLVKALEDKEEFETTGAILRIEPAEDPPPAEGKKPPSSPRRPSAADAGPSPVPSKGAPPPLPAMVVGSFYSRAAYRHAASEWRRFALVYLLALSLLHGVSAVYRFTTETAGIMDATAPLIAEQLPEIRIDGGRVRIAADEPYLIRTPDGERTVAVLDTTGTYRSLEGTEATVLLTEDRLLVRSGPERIRAFDLSGLDGFTLNRERMLRWVSGMMRWMPVVLFPFAVVAAFIYRLAQALLFAAVGRAAAAGFRHPLRFSSTFALAVLALTPTVILDALFAFLGVFPPYGNVLGIMIAAAFVVFGIRSCIDNRNP
jgi:hypothetical protein